MASGRPGTHIVGKHTQIFTHIWSINYYQISEFWMVIWSYLNVKFGQGSTWILKGVSWRITWNFEQACWTQFENNLDTKFVDYYGKLYGRHSRSARAHCLCIWKSRIWQADCCGCPNWMKTFFGGGFDE